MKKTKLLVLASLLTVGMLAGCGGNTTPSTSESTDSTSEVNSNSEDTSVVKVTSVTISGGVTELEKDGTVQLTAKVNLSDSSLDSLGVTWKSSNDQAATVVNGLVTALEVSVDTDVTITATSKKDSSKSASITIKIKKATNVEAKEYVANFGEGEVTASFSDEAGAGTDSLKYWNDQNWVGSNVTVNSTKAVGSTISFDFTSTGKCDFGYQLFYRNSALTSGNKYTISFTMTVDNDCTIKINDVERIIKAGKDNEVVINYVEGTGSGEDISSLDLQVKVLNNLALKATISELKWKDYVGDIINVDDPNKEATTDPDEGSTEGNKEVDYSSYTEIKSAEDFIKMVEANNQTYADKYYLSSNIDLGGAVINGRIHNNTFSGTLDGRGHTIKNFTVANDSDVENDNSTGLFFTFNGNLKNVHLVGTIDAAGYSGLLCKEVNTGTITNCSFEATYTRSSESYTSDQWGYMRNGVIAGVLQSNAKVTNCVTRLISDNYITLPFFAFSYNDTASMNNMYTNVTDETLFKPIGGGGTNLSNMKVENVKTVDYASVSASEFDLDSTIWTLEDNKFPALAHDGETASTLLPEVSASLSKQAVEVGSSIDLTPSVKFTTETPTYTVESDTEGFDDIVTLGDFADGKFTVTGKETGEVSLKVKAVIGEETYYSTPVTVKVIAPIDTNNTLESHYTLTASSAVGGAWFKVHLAYDDPQYKLSMDNIEVNKITLSSVIGDTTKSIPQGGTIDATTVTDTEIIFGMNFTDSAWMNSEDNTLKVYFVVEDIEYVATLKFVGENNNTDAVFTVTSQSCELVK